MSCKWCSNLYSRIKVILFFGQIMRNQYVMRLIISRSLIFVHLLWFGLRKISLDQLCVLRILVLGICKLLLHYFSWPPWWSGNVCSAVGLVDGSILARSRIKIPVRAGGKINSMHFSLTTYPWVAAFLDGMLNNQSRKHIM